MARGPQVGDLIRQRRRLVRKIHRQGAQIRAQAAVIQELKGCDTMNDRTPLTPVQQMAGEIERMTRECALLDKELRDRDEVVRVLRDEIKTLVAR